MWYNTNYNWTLKFKQDITLKEIKKVKEIIEEKYDYDLEITEEMDWIEWRWWEKTYKLEEWINDILKIMREENPNFDLLWELEYQWEESDDCWKFTKWLDWYFIRKPFSRVEPNEVIEQILDKYEVWMSKEKLKDLLTIYLTL